VGVMHIAIVLDGNRRYAKRNKKEVWLGHNEGAKKIEEILNWCHELKVSELTLYCFSMENFKRPKREVDYLFRLFDEEIRKLSKDERIEEYDIMVRFIGRLNMFPTNIQKSMNELMEDTKDRSRFKLNFAMAYGGRSEIVDAVKQSLDDVKGGKLDIKELDEERFRDYLYLRDYPDLIIRPGGEIRVSNFLTYQGAYSELWFTDKLWPEFSKEDLISAITDFKKRDRRFGE